MPLKSACKLSRHVGARVSLGHGKRSPCGRSRPTDAAEGSVRGCAHVAQAERRTCANQDRTPSRSDHDPLYPRRTPGLRDKKSVRKTKKPRMAPGLAGLRSCPDRVDGRNPAWRSSPCGRAAPAQFGCLSRFAKARIATSKSLLRTIRVLNNRLSPAWPTYGSLGTMSWPKRPTHGCPHTGERMACVVGPPGLEPGTKGL